MCKTPRLLTSMHKAAELAQCTNHTKPRFFSLPRAHERDDAGSKDASSGACYVDHLEDMEPFRAMKAMRRGPHVNERHPNKPRNQRSRENCPDTRRAHIGRNPAFRPYRARHVSYSQRQHRVSSLQKDVRSSLSR
ncbi:hypothetical protein VNO77_19437 [Canavalia gladiata]|uniref:Uncharacterized protein n=1 Tax=Canavalia gladiata TaxID=3824 RepID=A0AAN9LMH6_CANGL